MKLNKAAMGLALGICWGASIVLMTLWLKIVGGGEVLEVISKFYVGYSVSVLGAFIGMIYGFLDGFIYGFVGAWFYNLFADKFAADGSAA